ncbi:MAG: sialidase family protein, partial [Pseudomonadota bacterium]|nr:sialidase family protein [Pseudomonadota bacterium]
KSIIDPGCNAAFIKINYQDSNLLFLSNINSKFDRRETNTNIIKLTLGIIAFQILDFFIASQAQSNLIILGFLYLLPLAFLLILIYLLKMTYRTVGD